VEPGRMFPCYQCCQQLSREDRLQDHASICCMLHMIGISFLLCMRYLRLKNSPLPKARRAQPAAKTAPVSWAADVKQEARQARGRW
jgi:hypothetical protein